MPELNGRVLDKKDGLSQLLQSYPSKQMAAECINKHFCSSFSEPPNWSSAMAGAIPLYSKPWDIDISVQTVFSHLIRLDCKKSTGSDGISSLLLRECAASFAEPITHLFNLSVECQKVPQQWKMAHVIPVPKRRVTSLDDIRPISLLPIIFKIFESLVLESIKEKLIRSYGEEQFGFRPRSSTLLANIAMTDCIAQSLDQDDITGVMVISFDMSRAFDRLKHFNLLMTLNKGQDLPEAFISWCTNFLQDRFQRVKLESVMSSLRPVTSGVPQGSRLSPCLFSCHMGLLKSRSESTRTFKYADDIVMIKPIFKGSDVERSFDVELTHVKRWCKENGLLLNDDKTNVMIVRKGVPLSPCTLPTVRSMRILGVTFQDDLKWNLHTDNVVRIAARRIFVLRKLKRMPGITKEDLVTVYCAYVRSILEYNCPVFAGFSKMNAKKLDNIQRRCHRIICSRDCHCDIFEELSDRRDLHCIRVLKSILQRENIIHSIAPRTLSHSKHLSVPFCKTYRHASTFIPQHATLLYNGLKF